MPGIEADADVEGAARSPAAVRAVAIVGWADFAFVFVTDAPAMAATRNWTRHGDRSVALLFFGSH